MRNEGIAQQRHSLQPRRRHTSDLRPLGRTGTHARTYRSTRHGSTPRRPGSGQPPRGGSRSGRGWIPWPGQVFGLVDMRHGDASPTVRRFPATRASADDEDRFHTPLRGSAGIGPERSLSRAVPASLLNTSLYLNREMYTVGECKLRLQRCAVKPKDRSLSGCA